MQTRHSEEKLVNMKTQQYNYLKWKTQRGKKHENKGTSLSYGAILHELMYMKSESLEREAQMEKEKIFGK